MLKKFSLAAILLCAAVSVLNAQTKAETKLYNKTLAKPSVAAFDKFLKKYPSSVYSAEIAARKDTLLNITPYSEDQAAAILKDFLPADCDYLAIADRREAIDRIYGICLSGEGLDISQIRICTLEKGSGGWTLSGSYEAPAADAEGMSSRRFADEAKVVSIKGIRYLFFNYLMEDAQGQKQSYTAAYYAPQTDELGTASFSGDNILKASDNLSYKIYGRSNEKLLSGLNRPQMRLLVQSLNENSALVAIPEEKYLTLAAIQWWNEHNPEALTSATKLDFNIIQKESSLVSQYANVKKKKSSAKYGAALFDTDGYTVIVVYRKASDDYVLAWVEPECKNSMKDRLLNSISFDDANTISMSYYHGNRTFKYRLNLASHSLRR